MSKLGKHGRSEKEKADSKIGKHATEQVASTPEVPEVSPEEDDTVLPIAFNPRSSTITDLCSDPITNAMEGVWNEFGELESAERLELLRKRIRRNIEARVAITVSPNDEPETYKHSEAIIKATVRGEYTHDRQDHPCQFNINEAQVCSASGLIGFGNAGEQAKDLDQRKFSVSVSLLPTNRDVTLLRNTNGEIEKETDPEISAKLKHTPDPENLIKLNYTRDATRAKIRKNCITNVCYRELIDHALFQMYLSPLVAMQRFQGYQYDRYYSGPRKKLWKRYYEGEKEPIDPKEDADPMRSVTYRDEHDVVVDWRHPVVSGSLYLQFLSRMQKTAGSDKWYFLTKSPLYAWEKDRKQKSDKKKGSEADVRPVFVDWRSPSNTSINAFRGSRNVFLKKSHSATADTSTTDAAAAASDAASGFNLKTVGVKQFDFPYAERDPAKRTEFYKSRLALAEKMGYEVNPIKYSLKGVPADPGRIPPEAPFLTNNCVVSFNVKLNCLSTTTQFVGATFGLFANINVHVYAKADNDAVLYMKPEDGDVDSMPDFSSYGRTIVTDVRAIAAGADMTGMDQ